jgi:hypothetical protein
VKGLIDVQYRLSSVVAGWYIPEACVRVPLRLVTDGYGLTRVEAVHGDTEDLLRKHRPIDLHARLSTRVVRQ